MADPLTGAVITILEAALKKLAEEKLKHIFEQSLPDVSAALAEVFAEGPLPTTAFVGFGHCGETILMNVARELSKSKPGNEQPSPTPKKKAKSFWEIFRTGTTTDLLSNIEPLIVVGDLDKGEKSDAGGNGDLNYKLLRELSIRSLASSGSGNMPAKAQYLSRLALGSLDIPGEKRKFSWRSARTTLIDSVGVSDKNPLRLIVYVFSAGGGSGSGFLYEIAQAQRFLQLRRLFQQRPADVELTDLAFTLGAAVLPGTSGATDVQSVNSGRFLCRYLADRQRASGTPDQINAIPAFHAVILYSNGSFEAAKLTAVDRIARANKYISGQLLALVLAQTQKLDDDEARQRGSAADDLIHLDPSDLRHAVCGTTVVGFNYSSESRIEMKKLLVGAFRRPSENGDMFAGVSVDIGSYDISEKYLKADLTEEDLRVALSDLPVFKFCPGVTVVLSVPHRQLDGAELDKLRVTLVEFFPNARVRRVAIVDADSPSITVFISESGIFCAEAKRHLGNFIQNSFAGASAPDTENLSTVIGGQCQPLAILEAEVFLHQVAQRLKRAGTGGTAGTLTDVLITKSDVAACLEYTETLQQNKGLEDGSTAIEEWLNNPKSSSLASRFGTTSSPPSANSDS